MHRGVYERLLTEALAADLRGLPSTLSADISKLDSASAPNRIAHHLAELIERTLHDLEGDERISTGLAIARQVVDAVVATVGEPEAHSEVTSERLLAPAQVLRAILGKRPDGSDEVVALPQIPLAETTLLTNAPGEPGVGHQLLQELPSANRIDVVMAFVRMSGLRPFLEPLARHVRAGRSLRVLTTTFTGSTEARALDALLALGAEVRVSYDTTSTRLHAKAWYFYRQSGFSTAYIGSSNLSSAAQITGLEWNVRVSGARNPDVLGKMAAVFESYWASPDFRSYDRDEFRRLSEDASERKLTFTLSPLELRPEPFQERMLEQIALARTEGRHRNLLVSATGTGKTVMAALDYARLRASLPRARLLFVAHREEILEQSRRTFAEALRDPSFGEMWVGGRRPQHFEQVFASIQSLSTADLSHLAPDHFDVVIVDEFHHAAAASYRSLLSHLRPRELLGLTATPERADGLPVLEWFDGRIAAELRLWDAIDQHRLVPFAYFGIPDGTDLQNVPWKRGRGYDTEGLTNLLTADDAWAHLVLKELNAHVSIDRMRALGFCISVEHARFMARIFNEAGVPAAAVWSDTPDGERRAALRDLSARKIAILFSVDLFNEGVDVPTVDTLLLLRPTESPTLFLQQIGRGLRKSAGKTLCTILDFVGQQHHEFRFDRRLGALLGVNRRELREQVEQDFPFLPAGCHFELEGQAKDIVLASIKNATPSGWTARVRDLAALAASGQTVSLRSYLEETGLELDELYDGQKCWSDMLSAARLPVLPTGPEEANLRRALGRLLHIDDRTRLDAYAAFLRSTAPPEPDQLTPKARRLLRMLVASLLDKSITMKESLSEACQLLWRHPQVIAELTELLDSLRERISHLPLPLDTHPDAPLQVHARYTRLELLAGLGVGGGAKVANWVTGVRYDQESRTDILAFTLDKSSGQFSPSTRYRDYAITRELIHWESQGVVREESETGRRYREHAARGSHVHLFARLRTSDRAFYFLGPATYVKHEGEKPMAITWRLTHPLPGDLFSAFAAAVA